jgi:GNAT superfamily N-acetyltransferase
MDVTVRRGTADDARALARLRWAWGVDEKEDTGLGRDEFLDLFATWVVDHLATHLPFVVEVDGRLAGMAWLMLATRPPTPSQPDRRTGDVQSVFVVPELRNGGVGATLLGAVLAEARERGLYHVTVHSSGRAMPFYLRSGFEDTGRWFEWVPAVPAVTPAGTPVPPATASPGRDGPAGQATSTG